MRKLLLLPVLVLLFTASSSVWGTTYYVSTSGSDTDPYDTWAKAADHLSDITAKIAASGNGATEDHVYIAPGNYDATTDYILMSDADFNGTHYIGIELNANVATYPNGTETTTIRDTVILNGNNPYAVTGNANADNITFRNLTIRAEGNRGVYVSATGADNWSFYNICFDVVDDSNCSHLFRAQGTDSLIFERCLFRPANTKTAISLAGDSTGTMNYCIIEQGGNSGAEAYYGVSSVVDNGTGNFDINNSVIVGMGRHAVLANNANGDGDVRLYNCIVSGSATSASTAYPTLKGANNNVHATNCLIMGMPYTPATYTSGLSTDTNNLYASNPRFTAYGRKGWVIPRIDDAKDVGDTAGYVRRFETLLAAENFEGTYYLNQASWETNEYSASDLQALVTRGTFEVGAHSYSHSVADATDAFTLSCAGCGDPKYKWSIADSKLYLDNDGDGTADGEASMDLSAEDTHYKDGDNDRTVGATFSTADTAAGGGWAISYETNVSENLRASSITAVEDWTAAGTLTLDKTDSDCSDGCAGFYKDEVEDVYDWLNTTIGSTTDPQTGETYDPKTFANPYNTYLAAYDQAQDTSGFVGCTNSSGVSLSRDFDPFKIYVVSASTLIGADANETKQRTRSLAHGIAIVGGVVTLLAHNDDDCSTTAAAEWPAILSALAEFESDGSIEVTSLQLVIDEIATSVDWTDDGDGTYSRNWEAATAGSNFTLQPISPCVDAALDVWGANQTDYTAAVKVNDGFGNPTWGGAVDIGAYESKSFGFGWSGYEGKWSERGKTEKWSGRRR